MDLRFALGFVAVKAICPFSIQSPWSLIPSAETIPLNIELDAAPAIDSGITSVNSIINPVISAAFTPQPLSSVNPLQIWLSLLSALWVSGILVLLLYAAISCWRLPPVSLLRAVSSPIRQRMITVSP